MINLMFSQENQEIFVDIASLVEDALAQAKVGAPAAAQTLYDALSVSDEPLSADALYDLGRLALALERPTEALSFLDRALDLNPLLSPAHVDRGRTLDRLGRKSESIQALCRAVAIDPDAHAALNRLRWYLDEGRLRTTSALFRLARRGLPVASVLDVGAAEGLWSVAALPVWPDARYHLVEAFEHWRGALERVCAERDNFSHVLAAAGEHDGEAWFHNDPEAPYGGGLSHTPTSRGGKIRQVTLASEVERLGLKPPYLIKLDTHGFEVPILTGAEALLPQTSLLVIEVYVFHVNQQALLFHEICAWMAERGFRPIDLSEPMWRSHDEALWQFDLFFVPMHSPEFACNSFDAPG
ncbi:FkbM family methyltransferase [Azospirillum agricola]|uniref:FkbM family methyltransferase n=1 Tax=Azospirillum agricola TaxID=1720247 RepID=UPI001AE3CEA5|nr:FkbM family methyltransferase [Azospirillum agricola]MBP2232917.1 FkbM family methyltransferase [Azospirillum agricola]